jgi:hypothetical protein
VKSRILLRPFFVSSCRTFGKSALWRLPGGIKNSYHNFLAFLSIESVVSVPLGRVLEGVAVNKGGLGRDLPHVDTLRTKAVAV